MAITEGKEGEMEEIFEAIMTDNFPQIHVRHQTTESGNSVNTKQDNEKKRKKKTKTHLGIASEKAMAPHSSTLAWEIPWMEEPGRMQSMGSLSVGHD